MRKFTVVSTLSVVDLLRPSTKRDTGAVIQGAPEYDYFPDTTPIYIKEDTFLQPTEPVLCEHISTLEVSGINIRVNVRPLNVAQISSASGGVTSPRESFIKIEKSVDARLVKQSLEINRLEVERVEHISTVVAGIAEPIKMVVGVDVTKEEVIRKDPTETAFESGSGQAEHYLTQTDLYETAKVDGSEAQITVLFAGSANTVEAISTLSVMPPPAQKSNIAYDYQIVLQPRINTYHSDIVVGIPDRDTFSTSFAVVVASGLDEDKPFSTSTIPYSMGTVDYQIEEFVLSKYVNVRNSAENLLLLPDIRDVNMRDGSVFQVENSGTYSMDGESISTYYLGNATVTHNVVENGFFVDNGIASGNTIMEITDAHPFMKINDFESSLRGPSGVDAIGNRIRLTMASTQTPVTKSTSGLVANSVSVQSTVYFEDTGKLLFAHADGSLSVYDYTDKTETETTSSFNGLSLYSGSATAIAANVEIIPFQIV